MPGIVGTNPKNMKYFALHFQVVGDNVYYPFMINMNDVKGVLEIVGGDASSRGYKRWYLTSLVLHMVFMASLKQNPLEVVGIPAHSAHAMKHLTEI